MYIYIHTHTHTHTQVPAVTIFDPAPGMVVLRECAHGYSQGSLIIQVGLNMGLALRV
jgi:hypothetical protein